MARLEFAAGAEADLDRIFEFLAGDGPSAGHAAISLIFDALQVLERRPAIGRPAERGLRELVISRGKTGYVALYDFVEAEDVIFVLALRHQREAGFSERW